MDRIAREADAHFPDAARDVLLPDGSPDGAIPDHITHLTSALAREIRADAIVIPTSSGRAARLVARHRPPMPIVASSQSDAVLRQLALVWGVRPVPLSVAPQAGEDRLELVVRAAFVHGAVRAGDRVVVLAEHIVEEGERVPTVRVVRDGGRSGET